MRRVDDEILARIERHGAIVGNTPIRPLNVHLQDGPPRRIYAKLESENPTGSVKDRTAIGLLRALAESGRLTTNGHLIDSTSGNFGVAVAYLAREIGLRFTAVIDPRTTAENVDRIKEFGANIELVTNLDNTGGYLLSRLERVQELISSPGKEDLVWINQYSNPANPLIHYQTLGSELVRQVSERAEVVLVAVSTGGTFAGIAKRFRESAPNIRLVAVDVEGSVALGGHPARRLLTGIGASRRSDFVAEDLVDDVIYVSPTEAMNACHQVRANADLWLGGSGGAVIAAAIRYFHEVPGCREAAAVIPDRGENYSQTIYDDAWLRQNCISIETAPSYKLRGASVRHSDRPMEISSTQLTPVATDWGQLR